MQQRWDERNEQQLGLINALSQRLVEANNNLSRLNSAFEAHRKHLADNLQAEYKGEVETLRHELQKVR